MHILDWALHLDEGTPHIHERHVFDVANKYGERQPKQEDALKKMGFKLPDPEKKSGKYNNRKRSRFYTLLKDENEKLESRQNYMTVPAAIRELEEIR